MLQCSVDLGVSRKKANYYANVLQELLLLTFGLIKNQRLNDWKQLKLVLVRGIYQTIPNNEESFVSQYRYNQHGDMFFH